MTPTRSTDEIRIKLNTPGALAAAVPHIVGFRPEESLVVLSLRGAPKRLGLTMRFDLPDERYDLEFAEQIAVRLVADRAELAMVACCTATQTDVGAPYPRAPLLQRIETALRARGIELREALLLRDGRWWSYVCDDPACCDIEGSEVPDDTEIAAAHALLGRALLPSRQALRDQIKPVEFVARRSMQQALDRALDDVLDEALTGNRQRAQDATVQLVRTLVERYADPRTASLTDDQAARVIAGLDDVLARDRILAAGLRDDPGVVQRLFLDLCRRAVPPYDAPTCTVLAGLAYASGNGALANVALERALETDQTYSLALLFRDALHQQLPPELLRQAWRDADGELTHKPRSRGTRKKRRKAPRRH